MSGRCYTTDATCRAHECGHTDSLTSEWILTKVDYKLEDSVVNTTQHRLSSIVVTGPGCGSFSASGSKPQQMVLVVGDGECESFQIIF